MYIIENDDEDDDDDEKNSKIVCVCTDIVCILYAKQMNFFFLLQSNLIHKNDNHLH